MSPDRPRALPLPRLLAWLLLAVPWAGAQLAGALPPRFDGPGAAAEAVTRGPYLQLGTPDGVTLRWRTALPTDSRVWVGRRPDRLEQVFGDPALVTDHELRLTGLAAASTYYYAVGSSTAVQAGGLPGFRFRTAPPVGRFAPMRVWVLGDSGTADTRAVAVRDAYRAYLGRRRTDMILLLGDNAYDFGTDGEYQAALFDMYPKFLRSSVSWSARGNHDTLADVYTDLFTLPAAGEAGGLASGTESYYSFDWANVHFVCLDSFKSKRFVGSPMWIWLQADLAAHDQEWLVAFWHHPPYSKGSHDSDLEVPLAQMRENFGPLLEDAGVDLVLTGHSHSYERSMLIDGHYGFSPSFTGAHRKNGGDGRPGGDGAYKKAAAPHQGAVYVVAGSSGKVVPAPLDHPAMLVSLPELGSVVLEVRGYRMDVTFVDDSAQEADGFTIRHVPGTLDALGVQRWARRVAVRARR